MKRKRKAGQRKLMMRPAMAKKAEKRRATVTIMNLKPKQCPPEVASWKENH
jgi:hypothetical protein